MIAAIRVALVYLVLGAVWILYSDQALTVFTDDPELLTRLQTYKGWAFVVGSALLVYALIAREWEHRLGSIELARRAEERFHALIEAIPLPVLALERDGRVGVWNPAAESTFGWSEAEVLGKPVPFVPPELANDSNRLQAMTRTGERLRGYETERVRKDGSRLGVQLWSAPLYGSEGKVNGTVAAVVDMTNARLAQERIRRQLARLDALRAIDIAITSSVDLRVTLGVVLDRVTAELETDAAAVHLLDEATGALVYAAGRGFTDPGIERTRIRPGEGEAGTAALERRTVRVSDLSRSTDSRFGRGGIMAEERFVTYAASPLICRGEVKGVLEVFSRTPHEPDSEWLAFFEAVAGQTAIALDVGWLFDGLQRSKTELMLAYDATLEGWARALDLRDQATEGHSRRVTDTTIALCRKLGMHDAELIHVRRGALLHDIGKLAIPDRVLLKRGPLEEEEFRIIREHPRIAFEMLSPIPFLRPALDIPYCHHERWDGGGYPRGLKGEQIPLAARAFAAVDAWDAMRSPRPYRGPLSETDARREIESGAGTQFDPRVVETFLAILDTTKDLTG